MTCQSKMMSQYDARTVDSFFENLTMILYKYNNTIRVIKKFSGHNFRQSYEDQRVHMSFYNDCAKICGSRMAKVLSNHFLRGHGAKTEVDKCIILAADELCKGVTAFMPTVNAALKQAGCARRIK